MLVLVGCPLTGEVICYQEPGHTYIYIHIIYIYTYYIHSYIHQSRIPAMLYVVFCTVYDIPDRPPPGDSDDLIVGARLMIKTDAREAMADE